MKKSTIGIFVGIGISILAITFIPGLVKYLVPPIDTSSDEPVYHRVEAQRYEIQFPSLVNDDYATCYYEDKDDMYHVTGNVVAFVVPKNSESGEIFYFGVFLEHLDYSHQVSIFLGDDYGRYVISETQVADEPVAYTLEPIYEYVLVE